MKKTLLLSFIFILSSAICSAQSVKVDKYHLDNGMTVILHEDHSLPVATVNIWYRVGSKDEPERRSGFAHLFEHLMFMGTDRVPTGQYDKIMEGGGGANNASTAEDRTNYYDVGPATLLPTLLWLEADRLEDLGRTMTQKKLDLQRDVVKNERRQTTENTPYGKAYEALNGILYPTGHPYHTSVIGSMEDLDNAAVADVQAFFARFYVPNNASLVVAGDFNPGEIKPLIAKLFGTLPRKNDVTRKSVPPVNFSGVHRVTMVDQVQASKSILVWHSPASYQPGDAEMNLAASILAGGLNSRLYQRLVVKDKLATDVSANQNDMLLGSYFSVEATLAAGASQDVLEKTIDEELQKFAKTGPTQEELKRQSASLEYQTLSGLQSVEAKADKLNEYEFYFGEPDSFKRVLDMYRQATPNGIRDASRKTFDPSARLILRVVPESAKATGNPRSDRPALAAPVAFQPQLPTEFKLSNGMKVSYWNRPELPLMTVAAQFAGGADQDAAAKSGQAEMTADMLSQGGAGSLDAKGFSKALELLGAQFSASAGHIVSSAEISSTTTNFDKSLALFADALGKPKFDPKDWERVQRLTAVNLEQEDDNPSSVATKVAFREFWGVDHPYGRPVSGTPDSVRHLTVDDLKADWSRIFRPDRGTLFVAGSLPVATVTASLERALGNWHASGAASTEEAKYAPPANQKLRLVVVDKPGAVQTVVRFIFPAVAASDPNKMKLYALSLILGGSFTSRLNQNLREDKGYTYGAGSRFTLLPSLGYFSAAADVRADVTGASIKEFLSEFAKIRKGDITDAEASKAAGSLRTETIQSLSGLQGIITKAMSLSSLGLPFSVISSELGQLEALKASDLNSLVDRSIPLEKALLVLVGDKAQILKQLEGLGLPTAEVVKP